MVVRNFLYYQIRLSASDQGMKKTGKPLCKVKGRKGGNRESYGAGSGKQGNGLGKREKGGIETGRVDFLGDYSTQS